MIKVFVTMKKILIIEDNLENRENLEEILEMEGYQIVTASNGLIGLEKARTENHDLILCDIAMPEKNGYEVFDTIVTRNSNCKTPFIFLTAYAQEKEIAFGKKLGADAYLTKPYKVEELLQVIKNLI